MSRCEVDRISPSTLGDGKELTATFEVGFLAEKLGRPHSMNLGQMDFYKGRVAQVPLNE
jgi:hypothetical protein